MDQVGVSMFEQEAFLETLETILDRAQAGQPVWDWDQESAIDALLGVDEPLAVRSGAVSVVELDKPPVLQVVPPPPRPASPRPVVAQEMDIDVDEAPEETISIEDLAAELSAEDIARLDLPTADDTVDEPVDVLGIEVDLAEAQIEGGDADALMVESTVREDAVEEAAGEARIETCEVTEIDEVTEAADDAELETEDKVPDAAEAVESDAPANSLEALMRRRGLSAVAHVEEVELVERGGRG